MPDLQTALKEAIEQWETPTKEEKQMETKKEVHLFKPTNNVSRETFTFVKTHYGCTRKQVIEALLAKGFKESSIDSLLTQMLKNSMIIRGADGKLAAIVHDYTPIKQKRNTTVISVPKEKVKKEPQAPKPVLDEPKAVATTKLTAKHIVDNIGIGEAKALYLELKQIFGA